MICSVFLGCLPAIQGLIKEPGRGWLGYPIILLVLPLAWPVLDSIAPLRSGKFINYFAALVPVAFLTVAIALAWVAKVAASTRHHGRVVLGPLFIPMSLLILVSFISSALAGSVGNAADVLIGWMYIWLSYIVVYNTLNKPSTQQDLASAIVGASALMAILAIAAWLILGRGYGANVFALGGLTLLEKNHTALLLEEGLFLVLAPLVLPKKRTGWLQIALAAILIGGLLYSRSRGGWLSVVVAGMVMLLIVVRSRRVQLSRAVAFAIGTVGLAGLLLGTTPALQERAAQLSPNSSPRRFTKNAAGLRAVMAAPALGYGINNVDLIELGFTEGRTETRLLSDRSGGTANFYLRVGAETGPVGLSVMLWLVAVCLWWLARPLRLPISTERWTLHLGFFCGVLSNFVHLLFIGTLLPFGWLFAFFGVAAARGTLKDERFKRMNLTGLGRVGN